MNETFCCIVLVNKTNDSSAARQRDSRGTRMELLNQATVYIHITVKACRTCTNNNTCNVFVMSNNVTKED